MVNEQIKEEEKQKPPPWLIDNIAEASKNARKIYFLYMGFLAYCALTVVSTTDRQIILNETARLPIINLEVPLNGFFILAPLLAIFIFAYLQLYLQRLNGLISDLRTRYAPVEKRRLYPWMLNIAEDPEPGVIGRLQRSVVAFSLWWSLPIVLILFAFWFVRKHDPFWCYVVGMLPIAGTLVVLYFWCRYGRTQDKPETTIGRVLGFVQENWSKTVLAYMVLIFESFLLSFVLPNALEGDVDQLGSLRSWTCVDLSYQKLVTEPSVEYEQVYWLDLNGAHLEGANLTAAVLKRADLRKAQLKRCKMSYANLEKADLSRADLREAELMYANLREADVVKSHLEGANLQGVDAQGADLESANLQQADLTEANLRQADLMAADLRGARLSAFGMKGAYPFLRGAPVESYCADFQEADLTAANLHEVTLWGVNLKGASLPGADLRGVKRVTVEQFSKVHTLYQAKLDSTLMEQIRKHHPHLLEEPKPDE